MSEHSVTRWIGDWKEGDEAAAQQLWNRHFEQLVRLCRQKLQAHPRRSEDEKAVALSAYGRVFDGLRRGKFPQVTDRDDLWRLLVHIAAGKAVDRCRAAASKKRRPDGGGRKASWNRDNVGAWNASLEFRFRARFSRRRRGHIPR